jgi:hypothetical protein
MSRLCSCEGSNENCFWCSGSGFVDDSSPIRTDVGPLVFESKLTSPPERVTDHPPIQRLANKSRKQKKVHRILSKQEPFFSKPWIVICSECHHTVHTEQIHTHFKEFHPHSLPKPLLFTCSRCRRLVCETRLKKHVRKYHKDLGPISIRDSRQSSHDWKSDNSVSTKRTSIKNTSQTNHDKKLDTSGNLSLVERQERKQDATRQYAHAFRDRGQFGSYPSHDDYSDESGS